MLVLGKSSPSRSPEKDMDSRQNGVSFNSISATGKHRTANAVNDDDFLFDHSLSKDYFNHVPFFFDNPASLPTTNPSTPPEFTNEMPPATHTETDTDFRTTSPLKSRLPLTLKEEDPWGSMVSPQVKAMYANSFQHVFDEDVNKSTDLSQWLDEANLIRDFYNDISFSSPMAQTSPKKKFLNIVKEERFKKVNNDILNEKKVNEAPAQQSSSDHTESEIKRLETLVLDLKKEIHDLSLRERPLSRAVGLPRSPVKMSAPAIHIAPTQVQQAPSQPLPFVQQQPTDESKPITNLSQKLTTLSDELSSLQSQVSQLISTSPSTQTQSITPRVSMALPYSLSSSLPPSARPSFAVPRDSGVALTTPRTNTAFKPSFDQQPTDISSYLSDFETRIMNRVSSLMQSQMDALRLDMVNVLESVREMSASKSNYTPRASMASDRSLLKPTAASLAKSRQSFASNGSQMGSMVSLNNSGKQQVGGMNVESVLRQLKVDLAKKKRTGTTSGASTVVNTPRTSNAQRRPSRK